MQFDLQFPSTLTYVSTATGAAASAAQKSATGTSITGGVRVLIFGINQNAIGNGVVAAVRVAIGGAASPGTIPVTLAGVTASDPGGIAVPLVLTNGAVTVIPPADITPPTISSVASSGVTYSAATISWTTNEASDSQVEYGLTISYGSTTTLNSSMVTSHSQNLSGLAASTTYHYRVKSKDAAGNSAVSADFTFATLPPPDTTPPVISGVASSNITGTSATITWSTNEPSDSQIEYGTSTGYGFSTASNLSMVTSHSQTLTGLAEKTTYHYRVKSRDAAGNLAMSGDFTFTTLDATPPVISGVAARNVTHAAATITWTTGETSDSQVEYGTTTAYGSATTLDTSMVTAHSQDLSNLSASTTYHYHVMSRDAAGNLRVSNDYTFATAAAPDVTPPVIAGVTSSGITYSTATIFWTTNEASDTQVEYGPTISYGSSTVLSSTFVTSHSQALSGLAGSTTYHYRARSKDRAGNLAVSDDFTFTTQPAPDRTPPVISNVTSSTVSSSSATISWATDEASDSQVEYGTTTAYGSSTVLNAAMVTSHSEVLSSLAAGTTFHYRVKSKDAAGNPATSGDYTFSTLVGKIDTQPPAITDVFIPKLSSRGATITWVTDELSDSQIEYGTTPGFGNSTKLNLMLKTAHSQNLSKLQADTDYYFRVKSKDATGNSAQSDSYTFKTPPSPKTKISGFYPTLTTGSDGNAAADNQLYTGIAVANLSGVEATLTFTAYDKYGMEITGDDIVNPVEMRLGAGRQLPILDVELFGSELASRTTEGWIKVESTVTEITGFTLVFNSSLGTLDGTPISFNPASNFIFTEIEEGGSSEIHVANPDIVPATVDFTLTQSDGKVRATARRLLNPNGTMAEMVADLFPGVISSGSDYVRVQSTAGVVPFELFGKANQYLQGLNGQDPTQGASILYSPQYAVGGSYRSALSIVNLDSTPGEVTLRMFGDNGAQIGTTRIVQVAGYGKILIDDQSFFVPAGGEVTQGYVEVTGSGIRLAGSVVFGDPARATFASALPLVSSLKNAMVFSQVASNETYFTGLAILNPNDSYAMARIDLYRADGTLEATTTQILPARQRICQLMTQYFPSLAGQAWSSGYVKVTADRGLASFSLFGTRDLSVLSAVPPQEIPQPQ
jgi:hypothetical protein